MPHFVNIKTMDIFFVFAFGAVVGSFLNVCIYRLPADRSVVSPPSSCPSCGKRLRAAELVPVISFLLQRGRCKGCGTGISMQYPAVELLTAVLFVASFLKFGATPDLLFNTVFICLLIVLTFTDINTQIIPDQVNALAALTGLAYALYRGQFVNGLLAAILGAGFMYCVYLAGTKIYKKEAMGGGDIKLTFAAGAFFGTGMIVPVMFGSYFLAAAIILPMLLLGKKGRTDEIAFGPFIALSALIFIFFGVQIMEWYLGGRFIV